MHQLAIAKRTFTSLIRTVVTPAVRSAAQTWETDRYRKRFSSVAHAALLLFHHLNASRSARDSYITFTSLDDLRTAVGLPDPVCYTQFTRSNASRTYLFLGTLWERVRSEVLHTGGWRRLQLSPKLLAIDATFLRLSARLCPWARPAGSGHEPGIKLGVTFDLAPAVPEQMVFSIQHGSEKRLLPDLVTLSTLAGWTLLVDRGYYSHPWFDALIAQQVHFVTRLLTSAKYEVYKTRELDDESRGYGIVTDELVRLGTTSSKSRMTHPVRLVTLQRPTGEELQFVTDRFDLRAWEVTEIYRLRWQIELFFRFIKRQMRMMRMLGHSPNAVYLTLLSGFIAYLLVRLVQLRAASRQSFTDVFRLCKSAMFELGRDTREQLLLPDYSPQGP
jgi:hypothetical protein